MSVLKKRYDPLIDSWDPGQPRLWPPCPCGSIMVYRRNKRKGHYALGRPFWGCSRYPDCRYVRYDERFPVGTVPGLTRIRKRKVTLKGLRDLKII